jgi:hypothetical protein
MKIGDRCRITQELLAMQPRRRSKTVGTIVRESGECWVVQIDNKAGADRIYKGYVEPECHPQY